MTILHPLPAIGEPLQGGFYAGQIRIDGQLYTLIVAPKDGGENPEVEWTTSYDSLPGAQHYNDGVRNTQAMSAAGSPAARWAQALNIEGYTDWYLPSQDELEVLYRNLKPTQTKNGCYARSGINLSAIEPTLPYAPEIPVQTSAPRFQEGGDQAFADEYYWSSTQHAGGEASAWSQDFSYGNQYGDRKDDELRARAVRRLAIS